MSYRTLEEWNARGRQVTKGEKAMGKLNDGSALFGKEQTRKTPPRKTSDTDYYQDCSGGMDWDECEELGLHIGLPGQW